MPFDATTTATQISSKCSRLRLKAVTCISRGGPTRFIRLTGTLRRVVWRIIRGDDMTSIRDRHTDACTVYRLHDAHGIAQPPVVIGKGRTGMSKAAAELPSDRQLVDDIRAAFDLSAALDDTEILATINAIRDARTAADRYHAALASLIGLSLSLTEPYLDEALEDLIEFIPTRHQTPDRN